MNAYLFKGRLLQPMLDRILPLQGDIVAIDTCRDRVEELANFCDIPVIDGGCDLRDAENPSLIYRGVRMVFVNPEAREALEGILQDRTAANTGY